MNLLKNPLGLALGHNRHNGDPADVIGAIEHTPNRNVAVRIGGQCPDWAGGGWEQIALIVLTPEEREDLIIALCETRLDAVLERPQADIWGLAKKEGSP